MNQSKPNKTRPKVKQKRTRYNKLIKNISTSAATHLTNITLLSLSKWKRWSRTRQAPRLSNVLFFIFLKSRIFHRSWAPWASTIWAVGPARGPGSQLLEVHLLEELRDDTVVGDGPPGRNPRIAAQRPWRTWGGQERHDEQEYHRHLGNRSRHRQVLFCASCQLVTSKSLSISFRDSSKHSVFLLRSDLLVVVICETRWYESSLHGPSMGIYMAWLMR